MKKKISSLVAFCLCINFAYASKITDIIEKQTGQKTMVLKETTLNQDSNLKLITLKDDESGFKVLAITNKQESIFLPISSAFFTNNDKDRDMVLQEFNSTSYYNLTFKTQAEVKKAITKLPKDYIINLKGKNSKKVFYIISDPLCPHCQEELKHIDQKLELGDVKMIPIGWMGDESADKVAEIYSSIKNAKTNSEKINILNKIYAKTYKAPKADNKSLANVQEVVRALTGKGKVEATPYIIEEDL